MLFNSYEFLILFLPATIGLYGVASFFGKDMGRYVLTLASFVFYGSYIPYHLPLLIMLCVINFWLGRALSSRKEKIHLH